MERIAKNLTVFNSLILPTVHYANRNKITIDEINRILNRDVSALEFPDFRIQTERYVTLIEKLVKKTGDVHLGLHVGELIKPDHLGILGYLLMNCANIGEVIDKLHKYHIIIGNVVELKVFSSDTNWIEIRLSLQNIQLTSIHREILEGYIAGFLTLYRFLTGGSRYIHEIHVDWPEPSDRSEYDRIFQTNLLFNQPSTAIIFQAEFQQQVVISSNTRLKAVFEDYANNCYQKLQSDRVYSDKVVRVLSSQIGNMPGIDDVAFKLGLSGKSLQKKLRSENTTFNRLQDKVRFEFVKNYLKSSIYSVERACLLLGYSEPSAFYRAFKRWAGVSLSEYRVRHIPQTEKQ